MRLYTFVHAVEVPYRYIHTVYSCTCCRGPIQVHTYRIQLEIFTGLKFRGSAQSFIAEKIHRFNFHVSGPPQY